MENKVKQLLSGNKACKPWTELYSKRNGTVRKGGLTYIAGGHYGDVYRACIDSGCNTQIAVKITSDPSAEMEYRIAKKLKGFGVPDMYHFKSCSGEDILYFEFVEGTDMFTFFEQPRSLKMYTSVMAQILHNLHRIQEKYPSFRHHDLHGGNILIKQVPERPIRIMDYTMSNAGLEAVIIDFGFSSIEGIPNPVVNRKGHANVGIKRESSKMYDVHYFLNNVYYISRLKRTDDEKMVRSFIESILPREYLGGETTVLKNLRLRGGVNNRPVPPIKTILNNPFFRGQPRLRRSTTATPSTRSPLPVRRVPRVIPFRAVPPVRVRTPPAPPLRVRTPAPPPVRVRTPPAPPPRVRTPAPPPVRVRTPARAPSPPARAPPARAPQQMVTINKNGDLKIGTRKCRLYTKKDLVSMFKLDPKLTKDQMCKALAPSGQTRAPQTRAPPTRTINKNGDLKIGTRKCRLYTKKDLVSMFKLDPKLTKDRMCALIKILPSTNK